MPVPRVRLKDIAAATGVSVNTVSLALRGSPRIPEETRDRILEAAARANYLPNVIARSLVSRETKTVGLVLTDIMNPTLTLAAWAIERRLAEHGYGMMLAASDNVLAKELNALDHFRSRQADGILIYPTSHCALGHIRPLYQAGYPIVLLAPEAEASIDAVAVDDRRGACMAVRHLVGLGHRRIALLDDARPLGNSEKFEGYAAALAEAGVTVDEGLVIDTGGHGARHGHDAMPLLMRRRRRPTAIFTATDFLAIGALSWCRRSGIRVPEDLAIVGSDNIEAANFVDVPLTTVHYAADKVSNLAVDRLLALMHTSDSRRRPEVTLIEPELVVRRSCGAILAHGEGRATPSRRRPELCSPPAGGSRGRSKEA